MHLDRTQTWWELSRPWFRYQARCQWMLQEGLFAADVLFFCGEQAPNLGKTADGLGAVGADEMGVPPGYDWDICATKALMALKVVDGRVVVPGGVSYRMLVLPPSDTMSEALLGKIESLVDAGASVCAMVKPVRAPGLRGFPGADGRIRERADRVWAKGVLSCRPGEALARLGVEPDFSSEEKRPAPRWIHRRNADADWYFVALNNVDQRTFEVSFRQTGRVPEIWNAETSAVGDAEEWREEGGRTYVTLSFPPSGSSFVVFRRKSEGSRSAKSVVRKAANPPKPVPVEGEWNVAFPPGWDAPESLVFTNLVSWTERPEDGVRYFSGTATYTKRVAAPNVPFGARLVLDLGEVREFAEVTVNGRSYEVLWRPPFQLDVTDALDGSGTLDLSIRVTNLWPNRLVGDDRLFADDCEWTGTVRRGVKEIGIKELPQWVKEGRRSPTGRHTFTTWKHWDKDDKLLPSGLIGPVTLRICPAGPGQKAVVEVDSSVEIGVVKPVNGVGQPPMAGAMNGWSMFHYLKEAGIPYSRLHDVGGWQGQNLYVDIPNVFPDFEADENKPENYRFAYTDSLVAALLENGVEPFFRLGVAIENFVKQGFPPSRTMPPRDFAKWARICEHVIRHYTEGWAGGMKAKIAYWEIWNEPDIMPDPSRSPMWGASFGEYIRFYGIVASYLKAKFPSLKIGGYGCCGFYAGVGSGHVAAAQSSPRLEYFVRCAKEFLAAARDNKWPLDFFSYHSYSPPKETLRQVAYADELFSEYGFTADRTERIFDEWLPEPSIDKLGTARQASEIAATLVGLQNGPCDLACIYDARCGVGSYSPLFNPLTMKPHKAYYAFTSFNELRKCGKAVKCTVTGEDVFAAAACGGGRFALMVVNISDRAVDVDFRGIPAEVGCRMTDADRTNEDMSLPKTLPAHSFLCVLSPAASSATCSIAISPSTR